MEQIRSIEDQVIEVKAACGVITADKQADGGASHFYSVRYFTPGESNPSAFCDVVFQKGPINENGEGVNGIQNEDLLAIVIDRMRGFESGKYACRENALALTKLEEALMWLQKRTRDRIRRSVEGTHEI